MANNFIPQMGSNLMNPNPYGNSTFSNSPIYDNFLNKMGNSPQNNMQNPIQFLKCRPVSSKEEAIASQIDLDGSLWVFTDIGNGKIYTKQINTDGTATFKTYNYVEENNSLLSSNEYVTKNEFNKVIQSLISTIHGLSQSNVGKGKQQIKNQQQSNAQIPLTF